MVPLGVGTQNYEFWQTWCRKPEDFWGQNAFFDQKSEKNRFFLWQYQKKQYLCSRL